MQHGRSAELVVVSTGTELLALVTDISLGGKMSGVQLAEYAKRKFPQMKVIMVSAQSPPYVPHNTTFLLKPYPMKQLLHAVLN